MIGLLFTENRGLVAKKRIQPDKQIPRLLSKLISSFPPPKMTKRQKETLSAELFEAARAYNAADHFDFEVPATQ